MKLVVNIALLVLITVSSSQCYRIKRQNDMIFFPSGDDDFSGSSFSRPSGPQQPFGNQNGGGPRQRQTMMPAAPAAPAPQPPQQPDAQPPRRGTPSPDFLRCMKTCPTTTEYNPVCGTDQVQYHNEQRLNCANFCGASVRFVRRGNCQGVLATNTIRF